MLAVNNEEEMKHKLYELYQLDWMMSHGYSLINLMSELNNSGEEWHDQYIYDNGDGTEEAGFHADVEAIFIDWGHERGFTGGEMWSCFNEFCDAELTMPDYIQGLLDVADDDKLTEAYKKWLRENSKEKSPEKKCYISFSSSCG